MNKPSINATLVSRVVSSPKGYHYCDPETGKRSFVPQGEQVKVRASTARAHRDTLEDPAVLKAKLEALQIQSAAEDNENTQPPNSDDVEPVAPAAPAPVAPAAKGK